MGLNDRVRLTMRGGGRSFQALFCLAFFFSMVGSAASAPITIVALGASNTYGKLVSPDEAYPAQLEAMLRAKGYNARVINEGVNRNTTTDMLERLDQAVPDGTRLVILQPGGNDIRKGLVSMSQRRANIAEIRRRLHARGIGLIMLRGVRRVPGRDIQADGIHLTPAGYRVVASRLLPRVIAAIRRPPRRR